ncbi:hypothetical protein [Cohnella fermenti]|uniref:Uncharacterized protein n=1 Tax=Cohnella fermenti TaxID=2565925 RepID=A0A4S4BPS4_9BACL|nr:hypothetical protein [Cohnella fermenti]THF76887.1 hypothetical protein E6C55_17645 [Cohnella fermenti]
MDKAALTDRIRASARSFDSRAKLLRTPLTATYHTALKPDKHPFVLALYPSVCYAFDLLECQEEDQVRTAADIIEAVVSCQDQDPTRDTYGIWPYFYEEPLDRMDRPDWNMADFHGKKLLLIVKRHAGRLPRPLVIKLKEALYHACQAIRRRDVGSHYTNIAIMGAMVTIVGGELLEDEELRIYGERRIQAFYAYTKEVGTFSEYNSPCYTPIAIEELRDLAELSESAVAVHTASRLLDMAWRMVARHYHPATGAWGGPHSRTYSTLLRPNEKEFLARAMQADSSFLPCPRPYREWFRSSAERYDAEPTLMEAETGYQIYATSYQNDKLTLGSFSMGSMWNQRRNLIAYADAGGGKTVSIRLQALMNGKDFCSAIFTGVQSRKQALFAISFATDNGAWHQDLDMINGRFSASDLRIRLWIGGDDVAPNIQTLQAAKRFEAQLGERCLQMEAVLERSDYGPLSMCAERTSDGYALDYVIAAGEEREFDFHSVGQAAWLFRLSLDDALSASEVALQSDEEWARASVATEDGEMAIAVLLKPQPTGHLYRSHHVQMPRVLAHKLGRNGDDL